MMTHVSLLQVEVLPLVEMLSPTAGHRPGPGARRPALQHLDDGGDSWDTMEGLAEHDFTRGDGGDVSWTMVFTQTAWYCFGNDGPCGGPMPSTENLCRRCASAGVRLVTRSRLACDDSRPSHMRYLCIIVA